MDLSDLPVAARNGHIIPGLASNSLLSVVVLCDARCEVLFNKYGVIVKYNGKTVLRGSKCARTGLWLVPLQHRTNQEATDGVAEPFANLFPNFNLDCLKQELNTVHTAANVAIVLNTSSMEELTKLHHQSLESPPKTAIYRVLRNHPEELLTFPGMNRKLISRHLPPSTVTAKGHLIRTRKG